MKGKCTEDAILALLSKIHHALDRNQKTAALFLDLTKAFDLVNHSILLEKLCAAGFRGSINDWFASFLLNRRQRTKTNGVLSEEEVCPNVGVPQGSVLGPFLFVVYINSIFSMKLHGELIAYADDLALSYATSSLDVLRSLMVQDLNLLSKWFDLHQMILSKKSKAMCFSLTSNNLIVDLDYHHSTCIKANCLKENCFQLRFVKEFRYLGVLLDSNINWKAHIKSIKQLLYVSISKLYYLRKLVPRNLLLTIYYAIVQSRLDYGLACWGSAYVTSLKPLIVAHKKVVRVISNRSRYEPSLPLFQSLKILPLRYLYIYKVLKMFFLRSGHINLRINEVYLLRNKTTAVVPFVKKRAL